MTTTHTSAHEYRRRPAPSRPRTGGVPDVAGELRRLTGRDRWLIDLLHEHLVFTTEQVAALGFDHLHTARNRLTLLARRDVLARFRDCVRPGSQQWRWSLGWVGACWIAARDETPNPRRASIEDRINRLAASPRLGHLLGINGLFVDLAAHARHTPGARLDTWWSERTCAQVTGELARPDAFGRWSEDGRTLTWWLEYDRGNEPAHRVLSKLDGYVRLHRATGEHHAVLIRMQTARQEQSLHRRLGNHPAITGGLVAATSTEGSHPAGPVWLPAGHTNRLRLAQLPTRA